MKNKKSKKYTFSSLIERYKIEIPIIQRDYAQGRAGKEKLREKFLTNLHDAASNLHDVISKKQKRLELDFVYGDVRNDVFYPLDGQQRLTTLFLLHWYIAVKNNELEAKEKLLSRFTYETRTSSREFCQSLVNHGVKWEKDIKISELIKDSNWFFLSWLKDPTIKSMLTMLDAIHERFKYTVNLSWRELENISFYFIELEDFGLSDDLYVKMNARGKQLTGFENFKAELVGHVEKLIEEYTEKDTELLQTIAHKLDTSWTDIFWTNRSNDARIDDIYFAFINRFFLNQFITSKISKTSKAEKDNFSFKANEIEDHVVFKTLYGHQSNDTHVKYDGFDIYNGKLNEPTLDDKKILDSLAKTLDGFYYYQSQIKKTKEENGNVTQTDNSKDSHNDDGNDNQDNKGKGAEDKKVNLAFLPSWDSKSSFRFIPTYKNKENSPKQSISILGQKERIVFHATCCFFEKIEDDKYDVKVIKKGLERWMRVVWNIVENGGVNTIGSMIGTMRLVDELSEYSHSIYEFLASNKPINSDAAQKQVAEEREKAKQILYVEKANDNSETWEARIIKAENNFFFKGAIRFLFTDKSGKTDWSRFDNKHTWCDEHFNETDVKSKYKKDALLLKTFISYVPMNKWRNLFDDLIFSNNANNWKSILINSVWLQEIDKMLTNKLPKLEDLNKWDPQNPNPTHSLILRDLVNSSLLSGIAELGENYKLNYRYIYDDFQYERYMLYPSNTKAQWKMFMIGAKRNNILATISKSGHIEIDDWQIIEGADYYRGWHIHFTSKGYNFQWNRNGNIYLLDQNKKWIKIDNSNVYICISEDDFEINNFTDKLDELIDKFTESTHKPTIEANSNHQP